MGILPLHSLFTISSHSTVFFVTFFGNWLLDIAFVDSSLYDGSEEAILKCVVDKDSDV